MNTISQKVITFYKKYSQFIKYVFIGFSGVIIDITLFTLLTTFLSMNPLIANCFSISAGITNNFILNTLFNFRVKDKILFRFLSFYSIGIVGILLSSLILYIFYTELGFNLLFIKGITIFIVAIMQYGLNRKISFQPTTTS